MIFLTVRWTRRLICNLWVISGRKRPQQRTPTLQPITTTWWTSRAPSPLENSWTMRMKLMMILTEGRLPTSTMMLPSRLDRGLVSNSLVRPTWFSHLQLWARWRYRTIALMIRCVSLLHQTSSKGKTSRSSASAIRNSRTRPISALSRRWSAPRTPCKEMIKEIERAKWWRTRASRECRIMPRTSLHRVHRCATLWVHSSRRMDSRSSWRRSWHMNGSTSTELWAPKTRTTLASLR